MLFNSFEFLVFFPVVTFAYFLLPPSYRWLLLLIASCIFYMAFIPVYILILALTILIDYSAALWIDKLEGPPRTSVLQVSILSTCLVLFVFKYFNFFADNLAALARLIHWNYPIGLLALILPIGLSFHTFQSLSYVIEVYRGHQAVERNFGIYALYVMFYPQLVAGPIERPQNLLHQFYETHTFDYARVTEGLKLMTWGMFKKVVVADRLAPLVNQVYSNPTHYNGLSLSLATLCFAFQIYADFSGYSDIAIGAAQVMGFRLMINFRQPYLSASVSEFWHRWHISLSTWFRDYLYIPLGGGRVGIWRWYRNILITFLVSGLWHGANWTYVIWGALNGLYVVAGSATGRLRERVTQAIGLAQHVHLHRLLRIGVTFALITVAWVFFRAASVTDALYVLGHLFSRHGDSMFAYQSRRELAIGGLAGAVVAVVDWLQTRPGAEDLLARRPAVVRWAVYYALGYGILLLGAFNSSAQFIYFQF